MNVQVLIRHNFSVSPKLIEEFAHNKTRQTLARFVNHLSGAQIRIDRSSMRKGREECLCSLALESNRGQRIVLHSIGSSPSEAITEALKAGRRTLAKGAAKKRSQRRRERQELRSAA